MFYNLRCCWFLKEENAKVSPTVKRYLRFRFFFFSREEERKHVHVESPEGEAKFWLEPTIELAMNQGIYYRTLR